MLVRQTSEAKLSLGLGPLLDKKVSKVTKSETSFAIARAAVSPIEIATLAVTKKAVMAIVVAEFC